MAMIPDRRSSAFPPCVRNVPQLCTLWPSNYRSRPSNSAPAEAAPPVEPPPEPPAPSPDLEAQRRIEASIQSAQEYQRLSADEVHVGARLKQAAQNFYQKYGDPTPQQVAELEKTNPALVKQLAADYQLVLSENAHLKDLRERREFKERQISETRAAELAKVNAVEQEKASAAFEAHVTKVDPRWNDASYRTSLQQMAKDIIEEMRPGSSAAIARGEVYVTFNEQKGIYDAARARLMDQSCQTINGIRPAEGNERPAESDQDRQRRNARRGCIA